MVAVGTSKSLTSTIVSHTINVDDSTELARWLCGFKRQLDALGE